MTKTSVKALLLVAAVSIAVPLASMAATAKPLTSQVLDAGKEIQGNYFAAANNISIEGHVTGDLFCAGSTVEVKGEVDGDVVCAAQTLIISGVVHGSIRSVGSAVSVENRVGRNLMVVASDLIIGPKADIGMDAMFWAGRVNHMGLVNGSMRGRAYQIFLSGKVAQNVFFIFEDVYTASAYKPLIMQERASIGGNLTYRSAFDASIASRPSISGNVTKEASNNFGFLALSIARMWIWCRIVAIFSAVIIGLFLMKLWRKRTMEVADLMVAKPFISIGWGALVTVLIPVLAIFLAMTIIGLPISIILMCLWLTSIMIAKPVAAIMVGYMMMGRYKHKPNDKKARKEVDNINPVYVMILGVIVTYALMAVPLFGFFLAVLLSSWAIGAAWMLCKDIRKA
ncbi:MAG: polymer-forming cytoskeletal protein [Candidatus Falkowbacteria bacterium]